MQGLQVWEHMYTCVCVCMCVQLDNAAFMMEKSYKLVVSTPGAKDVLTRDREFVAFKGFPILGRARVYASQNKGFLVSDAVKAHKGGSRERRGGRHKKETDCQNSLFSGAMGSIGPLGPTRGGGEETHRGLESRP